MKELTDKYTASEKKAEAEHSKRIHTSMQSMLQSALAKGNALNPEAFVKLLRDKVEVGEDDSMSMKVGDKSVSIDEGVKDWLAQCLKIKADMFSCVLSQISSAPA